jgi:hypothetical protein
MVIDSPRSILFFISKIFFSIYALSQVSAIKAIASNKGMPVLKHSAKELANLDSNDRSIILPTNGI